MLAIDNVKQPPRNNYENFKRWQNWMQSSLLSNFGKKIEVKGEVTCTGQGHYRCVEQGEHSWFNHSMDTYHASNGAVDNMPPDHRKVS